MIGLNTGFEYINASFLSKFISYGCNFACDLSNVNLQAVDVVGYELRVVVGVIKGNRHKPDLKIGFWCYLHTLVIDSTHT